MTMDTVSLIFSRLSFLGACLIVALHVDSVPISGAVGGFVQKVIASLYRAAVPLFFLMSGYWLVGHVMDQGWWKTAVFKRLRTLGIPYVFFITATIVVLMALKAVGAALGLEMGEDYSFAHILNMYGWDLRLGVAANMWYVRCLFIFVLLSGFVVALVRKVYWLGWMIALLSMSLPMVFPLSWKGNFWYFGFNAMGFGCFVIGILLRLGRSDRMLEAMARWGAWALPLGVGGQLWLPNAWLLNYLYLPAVIIGLMGVCKWLPIPRNLGSLSFPIFAQHDLILLIFVYGIKMIHKYDVMSTLPGYLMAVVAIILCAIVITVAIRRVFPRFANVIYGGR